DTSSSCRPTSRRPRSARWRSGLPRSAEAVRSGCPRGRCRRARRCATSNAPSGAGPDPRRSMTAPQTYRGEQIGLPRSGPGALAPTGPRLLAFLLDAIASGLVAALFVQGSGGSVADRLPGSWSLIPFALDYVIGVLVAGRTLGMYLTGLRVIR